MSRRCNILAIFERKAQIDDYFAAGDQDDWVEVTKAWVSIEPLGAISQRGEFIDAAQTTSTRKSVVRTTYTAKTGAITTACRMKVKKPIPVDQSDATADVNYRIFELDSVVNAREQNRELEMVVVEKG